MNEFKPVRGMRDFLPEQAKLLRNVEAKARRVAELYGYEEIVTPVVESYGLLSSKTGEEVKSRMFLFKDLGGRDVALRPEFTASVARLVATTLRNEPKPLRLFCVGSIYRYDEPQRGRYREFWQSNYELMGSDRHEADAEILMLTDALMRQAGLKKYTFKIGHVGVLRGILSQENVEERTQNAVMQLMDKKQYDDAVTLLEKSGTPQKCTSAIRKLVGLKGTSVLEIADRVRELVLNYKQSVESVENLIRILELVSGSDCKFDMTVEAGFARGLEYYTGMIFEIYVPGLDIALGGGGRYNRLIEIFGGGPTPAVGVAHGLDRVILGIETNKTTRNLEERKTVVVIPTKNELSGQAMRIAQLLRMAAIPAELEVMGRKMAKALEVADRKKTVFAIIIGEKELRDGSVVIRNLPRREQKIVRIEKMAEYFKHYI